MKIGGVLGETNMVRRIEEKSNGGRITRSMRNFNMLVKELNLFDVPLNNGQFTWSDFREGSATRIDRFFLSNRQKMA